MISDRIPKVWDMTLRWRKCRTRWIELVYKKHLKRFDTDVMHSRKHNKKEKAEVAKRILNPTKTKFQETVDLQFMFTYIHPDYEFWNNVCTWNDYFSKHNIFWKNYINLHKEETEQDLIAGLSERYHINKDLASFVVKYLTTWK